MRRYSTLALTSVSFAALAIGSTPALAATQAAPVPSGEECANIQDEAAKQACADAAEQADPNVNAGEQATTPTQGGAASAEATGTGREIVVTGSRLRRDERSSADPLTVIDPNVESREGRLDTADILQSSPIAAGSLQITSTISSNFVVNGGEGVQTISLRGLGANRTLVLLNGRRAGPAGVRGGVSSFDLNVIPQDAIQSVEILKTGASSIYGSDAIAGVVNLITKKDLRGLNARAFISAPEEGGGEQYAIQGSYGLGLGDRGHLTVGASYNRFNELERGDRDFLGCEEENVRSLATGALADPIDPRTGEPLCGLFTNNQIQLSTAGANNLFGPCLPTVPGGGGTAGCAVGFARRAIGAVQYDPSLAQYLTNTGTVGRFFGGDGITLNPQSARVPTGFFPVGAYAPIPYALQNAYDERQNGDSVIPKTTRFTVYGEAGYDVTDDVSLYFEGLYNQRKTQTDASRQLFFFQYPNCFVNINPCPAGFGGDPLNTGFTGYTYIRPVIYAPASSSTDVKYFRGLGGARANLDRFLSNGFADIYFQHSRSNGDYARDIIYRDAIEFGVAELRSELCAGTVTAIRGVPCIDINYTDPRVLRGDFNDAERAFLFGIDEGNTKYRQSTVEFSTGGDLFDLPGGALKAAVGAQYRRDTIVDTPGEATLTGNLWQSTSSGVTAGRQTTREVFGEVELPLLRDVPFVRELTINGAARYTSTKSVRKFDGASDKDTATTYKIAANWRPITPLRLRATYGTSFRSPALFEQFIADESGFAAATIDPCRNYQLIENQEIIENCASQGIPNNFLPTQGIETFAGGGVGVLDPEKSKALTLSAIITPDSWLWDGGQFSFAIDYVDIEVRDQVTQLGPTNILVGCYTSDEFPTDPLCSLFTRAPATLPNGNANPQAYQIQFINDPYINIDTQRNKSIDLTARFRQNMGDMGTLSVLGQMTFQLKDKFVLFGGVTANDNGEVGDPRWVGDLNVTWAKNPFTVTYGLQVISKTNDFDDMIATAGTSLTGGTCIGSAAAYALRGGPYCPVYKLPRVAYHSLSVEYDLNDRFSLLGGVSNLFDRKPPLVSTVGTPISGYGQVPLLGSYYDYLGRRFFASVRAKLGNLGF